MVILEESVDISSKDVLVLELLVFLIHPAM